MVNKLDFFTPVRFEGQKSIKQHIQEGIGDYFYLGGKSAYVIPGKISDGSQEVVIKDQNKNGIKQVVLSAIKIISYMTVIIPLIMLVAKATFRATHKFHTTQVTNDEKNPMNHQWRKSRRTSNDSLQDSDIQSDIHSTGTANKNSTLNLNYFSNAEQATFWEYYLASYLNAVNSDKWNSINELLFLNDELLGIKASLEKLLQSVKSINEQIQNKAIVETLDCQHDLNSINKLEKFINNLILKMTNALDTVMTNALDTVRKKIQLEIKQNDQLQKSSKVRGIANFENTCYINAAMQAILALLYVNKKNTKDFINRIPDNVESETKDDKLNERRQAILHCFKKFIQAWKDKKSPQELGQAVADLRQQMFKSKLFEGGFLDEAQESKPQDAGQFFELIFHVLGMNFQLEITRTPVMNNGSVIDDRKRIEENPQAVFYLQLPGESLQEIVNKHKEAFDETFTPGNEWRIEHPETKAKVEISCYKEMQKIVGHAPEILVVRVNGHVVKPDQDQLINFSALFKTPPENCDYELVGFLKHYSKELHWTSVVYDGNQWQHCDDAQVNPVLPTEKDFNKPPASYLVYQKKG